MVGVEWLLLGGRFFGALLDFFGNVFVGEEFERPGKAGLMVALPLLLLIVVVVNVGVDGEGNEDENGDDVTEA